MLNTIFGLGLAGLSAICPTNAVAYQTWADPTDGAERVYMATLDGEAGVITYYNWGMDCDSLQLWQGASATCTAEKLMVYVGENDPAYGVVSIDLMD